MSDDAKFDDLIGPLREVYAQQIRSAIQGFPPHQALQLADALCAIQKDQLAGLRVHYKATPVIDSESITEDWHRGLSIAEIMAKHRCGKTTAYRFHPNKSLRRRHG